MKRVHGENSEEAREKFSFNVFAARASEENVQYLGTRCNPFISFIFLPCW